FKLCGEIRRLAEIDIEFKLSYQQLELNMQQFATDFISQARSSEEVLTVLTHPGDNDDITNYDKTAHSPLPKVSQALDLGLQKFIAHPNCQQVIIAQFYKRLIFLRDKRALYRATVFALLFLLFPVLAVFHLYSNSEKIKAFVQTPVVVFIMHLASDLTLVTLLTWESVSSSGSPHTLTQPLNIVLSVWIAGMTWREVESIAARGFTNIMRNSEHLRDIFIISLFLCWISFEIVALCKVPPTKATLSYHQSTRSVKALTSTLTTNSSEGRISEIGDYVLGELSKTNSNINHSMRLEIKEEVGRLMNFNTARCQVGTRRKRATPRERHVDESEDFLQLTWYNPKLIGSAMFALATTLSVVRMMSYVVISNVFGPLQISLVRMIIGTYHFFLVVGAVALSFAFGMTLIYSTQDNDVEKMDENPNNNFL
ncbi:short transient receptor potential channel 4-like, partial [Asterias rubens]|uniref:short transient receptor potential channel 4-like n=1 Tax=Asterias rubens TaxID=7604 RepID=UPI001455254A